MYQIVTRTCRGIVFACTIKPAFHIIVPFVSKYVQTIWKHCLHDRDRLDRTRSVRTIVKKLKRSNGNTLRRSGRSRRSKCIPEALFYPRIHCCLLCFKIAATSCELNSSLCMKEVKKFECLYNKFLKNTKQVHKVELLAKDKRIIRH